MPTGNLEVAKSFLTIMERNGIWAAIQAHRAEQFTWWVPGLGEMQEHMQAISPLIDGALDENGIRFTVRGVTEDGDRLALEAESHATLKNGRIYNNFYHFLFEFHGDRITRIHEYHDSRHTAEVWGDVIAAGVEGRPEAAR